MLCRPRMATAGAELSRNLFLLPLILSAVVVLWSEQLIWEKGETYQLPRSTVSSNSTKGSSVWEVLDFQIKY